MPGYDQNRISHLEGRLACGPTTGGAQAIADLEMLADLYLQADSYVPALETIDRLLALPESRTLSSSRRAVLESKAVSCRLARGDCQGAMGHCRELLRDEREIESLPLRSRLHLQLAEALFGLGRLEESRESAERCLSLAGDHGELGLTAESLDMLGRVAYRKGDPARARDCYEQAFALFRRVGDEASSALVRNNLGLIHKNLCEWETAASHFIAALEMHRRNGRYAKTSSALLNLGVVHQKSGHWASAAESFTQAHQVCLEVGDDLGLTRALIGLGNLARLERRFEEAERLLLAALEKARARALEREGVLATEFLGELDFDRGVPESALARYDQALPAARRIAPDGDLVVELERRRGEALCALGRLDEAERACRDARRLAEHSEDRLEHAIAHRVAGALALRRGRREEAIEAWELSVRLLFDCHERFELGRTLLEMGRALEDPAKARRCFFRAGSLLAELTTPYWFELAEAELKNALGPAPAAGGPRPAALMGRRHRAPSLVTCSMAMRRVETLARRAAATELLVLISGETGTGKELVARTIHGLSARTQGPFLAVNCGALRAELALSQLFGHRKGAFTGAHAEGAGLVEAAHGGTLFLDEIGELPLDVQVTLLRFLESGEYLPLGETQVRRSDVRIIAATNRELRGEGASRVFRRDLLFRLNEIEIHLPPLRERRDDIVPLARHFLAFYGGLQGPRLAADAESLLVAHPWPGNVRELENVMKRVAALLAGEEQVDATALVAFLTQDVSGQDGETRHSSGRDEERAAILSAYAQAHGNKSRVAELLGVSRKTLYARLKRLDLELS